MSVVRSFGIQCDACEYEYPRSEPYAARLLREARADGWSITSKRCLCPKCREDSKKQKKTSAKAGIVAGSSKVGNLSAGKNVPSSEDMEVF